MSELKQYSDLYEFLMPEVPGCPQPMILSYIKQKVYEFCDKTKAWMEWLPSGKLVDGRLTYHLECEYDAEIRRIKTLRINTEDGVTAGDAGQVIEPDYYEFDPTNENCVTLHSSLEPADDVAQGLEVEVIMVPSLEATSISRCFLNRWHMALRAGVLYDLLTINRQPWSDPARAAKFYVAWNDGLSEAKSDHHFKGTDGPLTISA